MEPRDPEPAPTPSPTATGTVVTVTVVRSGGFAGLTRQWRVTAGEEDAEHWVGLVQECPWGACDGQTSPTGADRFAWTVRATMPDGQRHAELAEAEATGPWRTLIDAVRAASD